MLHVYVKGDVHMNGELGFVDPTAIRDNQSVDMAPRPIDISGKTVGLLDNTKEQADVILQTVGDAFIERFGVTDVVICRKEHYSKPASENIIEYLVRDVDVVVAALGG